MPIKRSQLLKILTNNKKELEEAEAAIAANGSDAEAEAEVGEDLAVLRKNVVAHREDAGRRNEAIDMDPKLRLMDIFEQYNK